MGLLLGNGFSGWGQFLQSFCRGTQAYVISLVAAPLVMWLVPLQKLCKNCPHPKKLHSGTLVFSLKPHLPSKKRINFVYFYLIFRSRGFQFPSCSCSFEKCHMAEWRVNVKVFRYFNVIFSVTPNLTFFAFGINLHFL